MKTMRILAAAVSLAPSPLRKNQFLLPVGGKHLDAVPVQHLHPKNSLKFEVLGLN
jgi:hypothetical protein